MRRNGVGVEITDRKGGWLSENGRDRSNTTGSKADLNGMVLGQEGG